MNGGQPMRSGGRPGRRRAGRRPVLGPLLLGLLMAASVLVTARPSAPAAFGADAEPAVDPDVQGVLSERWGRRLAELDPSRPLAYLELAEEIDDARLLGPAAAGDPVARAERGLVLRLCGLAARLDSAIAPAAARAVADLSEDARERRRLLAVADLLEGDRLLRGREVRIEGVPTGRGGAAPSEVLLAASEAIARQRRGEGERALDPLARHPRDQVAAVFEPWPGGLAGFEQDCRRRPGGHDASPVPHRTGRRAEDARRRCDRLVLDRPDRRRRPPRGGRCRRSAAAVPGGRLTSAMAGRAVGALTGGASGVHRLAQEPDPAVDHVLEFLEQVRR